MTKQGQLVRLHPEATAEELADASVVAACGLGDRAARGLLFERHADAVTSFIARMRGSDSDAVDDLVQATFVGAFKTARGFRGGRVRSWLYGIAANVVSNYARGEIRRKRAMALRSIELPSAPDGRATAAMIARLPEAIAALPEALRAALVLVDIQGETGAEAAEALGIPAGTLWRQLSEARAALRQALGGDS